MRVGLRKVEQINAIDDLPHASPLETTESGQASVLLVDPIAPTRETTTQVLKAAGYVVVTAATGASMMELSGRFNPEWVLLASDLPDMSGLEAVQRYKLDPIRALTPVILCSVRPTTAAERAAGFDAGADSFLTQPIDRCELLALLRSRRQQSHSLKRLRKTSRDEKVYFDSLFNAMPDRVYLKDLKGTFQRINRPMAKILGLASPQEGIGRSDFDFLDQEYARKTELDEERVVRTGKPMLDQRELETWLDGRRVWVSSTKVPLKDAEGRIVGIAGISRDISKRVEAEAWTQKLSQAVDASPLTVVITDRAGRIEYTNPNFTEVTGYTAEEARGLNPRVLKSGEMAPENYRQLWHTISHGGTWRGLFHNRKKSGELYWDEASISPIRDDRGRITHYLAIKMDVTARVEAEIQLEKAKNAAEVAAQAKSEFLANMSHEIRTPMNGVIGMTELLLDTPLDADQRQFAETMRECADNLLVVINDILDFSKIEAGKLRFEELDFNMLEAIEGALDIHADRAQSQGVELVDTVASNVPHLLRGDPGRLRQILTNLLSNALKFTERGEVVLRVELEDETAQDATLRFSITDTGIGIPPEAQRRLFNSFEQADGSTTRKYGGTGLGLAICKKLVTAMGGDIGIDSEVGRGSTFWFTGRFPKQTGAAKPTQLAIQDFENLRALVVDDNATNRQILSHQLAAWKMQQGSANGGATALTMLRESAAAGKRFDLALLDMQMPEMDGLALARAIKNDPHIAATRLIMLTSLGERFTPEELEEVGLDAYLVKPVKKSRLHATLVNVISGQRRKERVRRKLCADSSAALPDAHRRVLLAEDNPVNQKIAIAQLGKMGLKVDVVANGQEALDALFKGVYDLVLMDCQMPVMDGYEASRRIRQWEAESASKCAWPSPIPIVAMTANALAGDRKKCLDAGMDEHITKPVRAATLHATLKSLLPQIATAV
jgi:two-component system, sensor histidine kinase and response regulator